MTAGESNDAASLLDRLNRTSPHLTHLLGLVGEMVNERYLAAFIDRYGAEWASSFFDEERTSRNFHSLWMKVKTRDYWEGLELLWMEEVVCRNPAIVAQHLPSSWALSATLHDVRRVIAIWLYTRARSVNWREPLTFIRGLRAARHYLTLVAENLHLPPPDIGRSVKGRLANTFVLEARYESLSSADLRHAIRLLEESIDEGNTSPEAVAYLAEAMIYLYDETNDSSVLAQVLGLHVRFPQANEFRLLATLIGEAALRLIADARSLAAKRRLLEISRNSLGLSVPEAMANTDADPLVLVRTQLVRALADVAERHIEAGTAPIALRGARLPFGLKEAARSWGSIDSALAQEQLMELAERYDRALKSQPRNALLRRVAATARSSLAMDHESTVNPRHRELNLRYAIRIRAGDGIKIPPLTDPESGLEQALDTFALFGIDRKVDTLLGAIRATLRLIYEDPTWATPVIVLATAVSKYSQDVTEGLLYAIRDQLDATLGAAVRAGANGDNSRLFQIAAERALASRHLSRKNLGGRRGVFLAEDYAGIASETFVFKPTMRHLADREDERAESISRKIVSYGESGRFSVARTLAVTSLPQNDPLRQDQVDVIVAKEFHPGTLAAEALTGLPLHVKTTRLQGIVEFLALIHSVGGRTDTRNPRIRRDLRKKELGRWLRSGLRLDSPEEHFGSWWARYPEGWPCVERRDAHLLNWVLTDDGGVVALDLEACGYRPLGYELAQLTDDKPVLPVSEQGFQARAHLVGAYADSLKRFGLRVGRPMLYEAYELALVARFVNALTFPNSSVLQIVHGEEGLAFIADHSRSRELRRLSAILLRAWQVRRGVRVGDEFDGPQISPARRRHLSRGIAYELRHGDGVLLHRGGWAYAASVADALNRSGYATNSQELLGVANSVEEHRFEVQDAMIRARYGHTRLVEIDYDIANSAPALFHGTSLSALDRIFGCGEGLRPMGRQWVHMSSSARLARMTAERHGSPVVLRLRNSHELATRWGGGTVYLVPEVPALGLQMVSEIQRFLAQAGR